MPTYLRLPLSLFLAALLISPASFAFNSPLSEEAIREAYFLGQRHDGSFARLLDNYSKRLPPPKSGPHISSITFLTPFAKLVQSVHDLGLSDRVHAIAAAILDDARPVHLSYCQRNSLYAQIVANGSPRAGDAIAHAPGMTLDGFHSFVGVLPALVKIDVEGSEVAVLRGAKRLLARPDRPALLFEYNPDTLLECGAAADSFHELLSGYALHYVDDFEGRMMPFGSPVARVEESQIACNLFAVPLVEGWSTRWAAALESARSRLGSQA